MASTSRSTTPTPSNRHLSAPSGSQGESSNFHQTLPQQSLPPNPDPYTDSDHNLDVDPYASPHPPRMVPPLPSHLITTILTNLLPPAPPLPPHYTAKALLDRLTFLPPQSEDLDAWFTPYSTSSTSSTSSSSSGQRHTLHDSLDTLSEKLERLSSGYELGEIEYGSDGEEIFARLAILPPISSNTHYSLGGEEEEVVEVIFTLEEGDDGRGWVYLAVQRVAEVIRLDWTPDPSVVSKRLSQQASSYDHVNGHQYDRAHGQGREEQEISPENYWAGFSPPSSGFSDLPSTDFESEDAYWASYGTAPSGPVSGIATPAVALDREKDTDIIIKSDPANDTESSSASTSEDSSLATKPSAMQQPLATLTALLSSLPSLSTSPPPPPPRIPSPRSALHDKLLSRISSLLREAWADYSGASDSAHSAHSTHEVLEEKAMNWLRFGRAVVDASHSPRSTGSANGLPDADGEEVVRAKLEVLRELHIVLEKEEAVADDAEGEGERFWRLIESTIKMAIPPAHGDGGEGMDQETYWE